MKAQVTGFLKNIVNIKGTNKGLLIQLNDMASYTEILDELKKKVSDPALEGDAEVQVQLANRHYSKAQLEEIKKVIHDNSKMKVIGTKCDVVTVEECNRMIAERQSETYVGIVRSGQVVKAKGDLVVIGDVNQNGRIEAGGNVYVLGRLKGFAHAGASGNKEAVIAASWLEATHLKIADELETMTDELDSLSEQPEMECAYLHTSGKIIIDRLQELRFLRPQISTFKGGS
ncbi:MULTISPECIES: septum site-determining protein MinC [unclassified Planococcus (in: firmicutes)]|uniref:septum site-determining protein MinC n=1 Tax=Planococcus TaxID=1372 RepID=UPI000C34ABBE|nr:MULTISPECIES: septum site-determining protein MinC [unclassified Planococcus (in: firmicutes)]AUD13684.1 septum site-determining protein MinC [Planococcus sp. MB-3u-03]PKG45850.1 septum site-determining protein MinC [Planococcus sp. Urea-trap-24]PKG88441.1 septum site-determining protein MinC [Planococcus sp. Urea-3u-39]PKH38841.1 septum site-determining protein MinC [Planococcus sp. MB-3u-09]